MVVAKIATTTRHGAIEDKVNKKDSENREFNWKLVGGISFALMTVAGISAGILGGKLDLKLPKKDR